MVKEYINADGYRIRVSEKAYRLLYKKNGFVPVEDAAPGERTAAAETGTAAQAGDVVPTGGAAPTGDMAEPAKAQPGKAGKGKTKPTASKAKKTAIADQESHEETDGDAADQDSPEETDRDASGQDSRGDTAPANPDTAEQPEDK